MFIRLYDEGGSGGDSGKETPEELAARQAKEASQKKEPDPEIKGKPGEPIEKKPEVDDTDYKTKLREAQKKFEDLDTFHKRFQSETTGKLQELADFKKVEADQQAKAAGDDELTEIDTQVAEIDKQIPLYDQDKIDTTALRANRLTLKNQRKQIVRARETQALNDRFSKFSVDHSDFTDFVGLGKIIADAKSKGSDIGPELAHEIWSDKQKLTEAKESAAIDADSDKLGDKALGQDGKPLPKSPDKPDTTTKFYEDMFGKERAAKMLKTEQ